MSRTAAVTVTLMLRVLVMMRELQASSKSTMLMVLGELSQTPWRTLCQALKDSRQSEAEKHGDRACRVHGHGAAGWHSRRV